MAEDYDFNTAVKIHEVYIIAHSITPSKPHQIEFILEEIWQA